MNKMLCIVSIFVLVIVSYSFGQDVAVVYDANLENGTGLGIAGGQAGAEDLADLLVAKINGKNLKAEIVDSEAVVEYMNANPQGIILLAQGNVPETIFASKGSDDLIHSWLRGGGIAGMIGDYPFYYYWNFGTNSRVEVAGGGQQSVFGVQVTRGQNPAITVAPTDLGKQYMPSLKQWTTNRAVEIGVLEQNNFEFESYSDNGTHTDPVAYRTNDMEGWFINFHTSCCGTAIPGNEQVATEFAELMANRFATESQSVDPVNKVSVVWGALKSQR